MFNKYSNDSDYLHAQPVWNVFNCQNLHEYSNLYLKIDVLLLADIFENFSQICGKTYGLEPGHYYGSPGLFFDSRLVVVHENWVETIH